MPSSTSVSSGYWTEWPRYCVNGECERTRQRALATDSPSVQTVGARSDRNAGPLSLPLDGGHDASNPPMRALLVADGGPRRLPRVRAP